MFVIRRTVLALVAAVWTSGCVFSHEAVKGDAENPVDASAVPLVNAAAESMIWDVAQRSPPEIANERPGRILRTYVTDPDWVNDQNANTGHVVGRHLGATLLYEDQAGACRQVSRCLIAEDDSHGQFGEPRLECGAVAAYVKCSTVAGLRPSPPP